MLYVYSCNLHVNAFTQHQRPKKKRKKKKKSGWNKRAKKEYKEKVREREQKRRVADGLEMGAARSIIKNDRRVTLINGDVAGDGR